MSGSQKVEVSRKVETDAPPQIIYRIDKNRYLTLENYISCDKGGQVYYNDSQRGIKHTGWDIEFYDFSYRRGNNLVAYKGSVINGADNGYLALPAHLPDNIVVVEGQSEVVLCFSSFQQIMENLYL